MTSLRLFETDGPVVAEAATSHLFGTPSRGERYRKRGWPYAASAVFHGVAMISIVVLARALTPAPRPTPEPPPARTVAHTFVFGGVRGNGNNRPRTLHRTQRSTDVPVAVAADADPAPLPPPRAPDPSPIVDEKPLLRAGFDPPVPAAEAPRLVARHAEPREAGFGTATSTARGLPSAEVRPGGFGEGNVRDVKSYGSLVQGRAGFDGTGEGDGAAPPRIQEPLPVPNYPTEARTRRLQGVVVLEVMLDAVGKAHVRGVLSEPLGFGIEEAATNAAEKLRFTPARQDGRFVDAIVRVRVTFTLTGDVATAVTGGA